jgi:hypothetical protein
MKNWKIDFNNKIIYVPGVIFDTELLKMLNEMTINPKGLKSGPGKKWKIITTESN